MLELVVSVSCRLIANKGVQCMFVGYAKYHAGDVYIMYDPESNRGHITRDVIWLHRMFYEKVLNPEVHGGGVLTLVTKCPKESEADASNDEDDDDEVETVAYHTLKPNGAGNQGGTV